MSCARASTTQPSARRNTLRSELYEKNKTAGFTGDLYGTDPVVEFHAYLSPSKKFDTLDELRECIDHAAQRAQEYFAE